MNRLPAPSLDDVDGTTCVGHSGIGWRPGQPPPQCTAPPKFTAGGWPTCGQHVGWLLRHLVEHGHHRVQVEPIGENR